MKTLLTLAITLLLAGCSTTEADRAFFQDGWMRPEEGADRRINSSAW